MMRMRCAVAVVIALSAALLLAPSARAANAGTTAIVISPAFPQIGQPITVTVRGTWSDSCVPKSASVTFVGRTIRVDGAATQSGANCACAQVLSGYTVSTTFTAPSNADAAGPYTIEYNTIDCAGVRRLDSTLPVFISNGGCSFTNTLTVA